MKLKLVMTVLAAAALVFGSAAFAAEKAEGSSGKSWVQIFNGKNLDGWKISKENPEKSFFVTEDGLLATENGRAHLFYDGEAGNHNFKNFEWQLDVKTTPGSNSGLYFHTEYQEEGWPSKGYEAQINNTHKDWKKTGGLYSIVDVREPPAKDNEWFHYHIKVEGKRIVLKINGKTTVDYTEPENPERPDNMAGRLLNGGTIAIQAHDPKSKTYFKNIWLKVND